MKIDFQKLNLAPMPNPKPLKVERVELVDGEGNSVGYGVVRNANLSPEALIGRW